MTPILMTLYGFMLLSALLPMYRKLQAQYVLIPELLIYFYGLPFLLSFKPNPLGTWLIINFCCLCLLIIHCCFHAVDIVKFFVKPPARKTKADWRAFLRQLAQRAALIFVVVFITALLFAPQNLFGLLRAQPFTLALYLSAYGLLSAFPQEFAYRYFFFRRYGALFPNALVLASSLTFAFAHIIFHNYLALALTFAAGYLVAKSYARQDSLLFASIEHAVYGGIAFTVGLDQFFRL